jgi:ribosomal protein L40E
LAGILLAVTIGYLNYDDLVVPTLWSRGVDWVYRLAFALVVAGIGLAIAFEIWQTAQSAMKSRASVITLPPAHLDGIRREEGHDMVCGRCGTTLPGTAAYCSHCGEKVTRDFDEGGDGGAV